MSEPRVREAEWLSLLIRLVLQNVQNTSLLELITTLIRFESLELLSIPICLEEIPSLEKKKLCYLGMEFD